MYKEIKSRRLALLVAIALTGGSLAGATNAYAADVTGQNVTINASNPPTNNATDPYGNPGSAAGAINDPANGDDVSGNTLTLADYDYRGNNIFGGFTRGTGRAKDNIVHIRSGGTVDSAVGGGTYSGGDVVGNQVYLHAGGLVNGVVGGYVDGASGSAENNHVVVESGTVNDVIYGGQIGGTASMGHVTGNTVTIAGGVIDAPVYGGDTHGSGNVTRNEVTVTGGEIHGSVIGGDTFGSGNVTGNTVTITGGEIHSFVFGGDTHGSGNVTGNTVTITGGEIRDHVYGGFRNGDGDVKDNIVNIGDGAHDLAAGTRIDQSIYGGFNNGGSGTISGNTLNVKASASAQNIHNFDTINFHFTNTLSPKLTLSDTTGTTINRLRDITVNGFSKIGTSTLIENTAGTITVSDTISSVTTTGDTAETILSTDRTGKKIDYARYIFKGARTAESSIYHETWGGRSVIGNTTTGNEITVTSGTHNVVYGGWTSGSGSTAATENRGDSTYNKVTVDGTETVSGDVYGGMTTVADGKASHNEVTINKGVTLNGHGYVYGGSTDDGSSADNNKVYLNGIRIPGTVYGGTAANGTANGNEVHLNGATVTGPVYGGNGVSTSGNKVYLLNGATVTGGVYGGNATSANDNEVHLNGATVTGSVYGGAANGTGNLLSVKGVNSARWIAGFQKVSFDTAGVAAGQHMLTITDTANRTALDWNALTATGTARGIDLIYHEQGIDLSHYTAGSVKYALSADGKSEYDIEAVDEGGTVKRIAYNSYRFKGARTAESSIYNETWGGRSVIGNTTTDNVITVTSGTHTDVYGGWTRGSGSTATDKGDSISNNVTVSGTATVNGNVYGGMTTVVGGKASNNVVTINEGVTLGSRYVYGGSATNGSSADNNKVYLNGIRTSDTVYGGSTIRGTANGNEVHLNGATVTKYVYGGDSATSTSKNKVYLNGATVTRSVYGGRGGTANDNEVHLNGATVTGDVYGGLGTGNLLSVKGVNRAEKIAGFQKVTFDATGVAADATMLNLNGSAGTTLDRGAIDATGSTVNGGITLLHNANGITVNGLGATDNILKSEADATTEKNIAAHRTGGNITDIRYEGYRFAGVTTPVIDGGEAFGGISRAGNATHDNVITVNRNYTNVYGGHTSGAGTTRDDKNNSYRNSVTITGGTLGNVYGGYTAAADGTTNHNTVTLAGGTVTGTVSGGNRTADGNTLNVVGMNNRAGSVENFQNMNFDATGAVKNSTLLTVTGTNATKVDWTKLTATGTSVKPLTLLKNESGIDLTSYTGAAKSETTDTAETNVDVRKNSLGRITAITYEGYQFARAETASVIGTDAFGGISKAGNSTHDNAIAVSGDYTNVYGGHTSGAGTTKDDKNNSYNNAVTITGGTIGTVYGGYTAAADGTTNHNTVTLAGGTVTGTVSGGNRTADGNTLNVNTAARVGRIENFEKVAFKDAASKLTLTDTGTFNLNTLEAGFDATADEATLVESGNALTLTGGKTFKSELNTDGTQETNLDVRDGNRRIVRYAYTFKGATAATTVGTDTWGGRSAAGNTTTGNEITLAGRSYTNVYGGWTTGAGSTATDKGDSISNKVTVNGSAAVSGTVYGGYTDVTGGRASNNTVSLGSVTVNQVVGGEGTTTDNNTVNINGTTVRGTITGGTQTNGTGNTLNVAGTNTAANIVGFQKVAFNMNGVAAHDTMLNLTGGAATKVDWTNLTATGTAVKPLTLLKNDSGIDLADYTGAAKSETTDTTETNVDVRKNSLGKITAITYEGYQFAGVTTRVVSGTDVYGGISRAGNATHTNHITVNDNYTNVYGGHTSGTSTTAVEKKNSHNNTVTIAGGTIGNVYGGYTAAADGTTNNNTVTLAGGTVTGTVSGGNRTAQGNKLVVNANARVGKIENFEKYVFNYKESMAADPMLTLTGGAASMRLDAIEANGTVTETPTTLVHNAAGLTIADYDNKPKSILNADGTRETNLDVRKTGTLLTDIVRYASYSLKGTTESTTNNGNTWGGRSAAGNTTAKNSVAITGGNHTDIYGGWTTGAGSTATDKGDSTSNKVTVNGSAAVSGTVYGGYSDVTGGKATRNEVTVDKAITGSVVGGQSAGDATGNTVAVNANAGAVTGGKSASGEASGNSVTVGNGTVSGNVVGGDGTTTNKNIVSLVQANVTGSVTGGSGATANENTVNIDRTNVTGTITGGTTDGTGNTLNVKGQNAAQNIVGFQKVAFNTNGVAANGTVLNLTGGAQTKVDWKTLTVEGNGIGITLLNNNAGIDFGGTYTDGAVKSGLSTDRKSEINVSVVKDGSLYKQIQYAGSQFTGVTQTSVVDGAAYGGISKAGNATHANAITVNGDYTNVYGGHTSGTSTTDVEKKNSYNNAVTISGGTIGNVYGGYTAADGTTNNNTVTLAGGTVTGTVSGGNRTALGNTLNVDAAATVGRVENFEKVAFKDAASKLTLTDTGTFNLDTLATNFEATANPVTLVESANALSLVGGKAFKSELNADGTQETDLDVRGGKKIVRYAYTFAGAKAATTVGADTWGGRSAAGNTTTGNEIRLADGSYTNVYGGRTTGAGSTAAADKRGNSISNKVTVNGTAAVSGIVYGGYTDVKGGRATDNVVTLEKASVGSVVGGYGTTASGNVINLTDAAVSGSVTGGIGVTVNSNGSSFRSAAVSGTDASGMITNDNIINLRNTTVGGTVTGGTAANGTGNTLAVYYGTGTSSIGDFGGIQNLHFDLEDAPTDGTAHTMLNLTNVSGGNKTLSDMNIGFYRTGAAKKLEQGDTFTLVENTTAGGSVNIGDNVKAEGKDGSSRSYTFNITKNADGKLVATVAKMGVNEQNKSYVETRTGASAFLNSGADFLAGTGTDAAKKEAAAAATTPGAAPFGLWAGMGGGSLRHETGSYVEMKGWNLGVGWARENAVKAGTLTFGPFIEYGRGSYDSYLDDGTHGSGKTSYLGAGMMVKLETKANTWIDGSLRVGRTKSDYTGRDNSYDMTSTYYAMHVSVGKDFRVREGDTVSAYVRYAYAHTAGTSAHLSKGETYDFDAVNSHRLRIGTRYTHGGTALSQIYAGLAWEYEFDGDARATYQGDSTPSPSLKGGSALLELGYRFAPKADSRVSYDLNLSGWQGKRQGVTGGVSVKWAF